MKTKTNGVEHKKMKTKTKTKSIRISLLVVLAQYPKARSVKSIAFDVVFYGLMCQKYPILRGILRPGVSKVSHFTWYPKALCACLIVHSANTTCPKQYGYKMSNTMRLQFYE